MSSIFKRLALAAGFAALAVTGAQAQTEIVFAHVFAANSLEQQAAERFAAKTAELSGGALTVTVFPASQLGGWTQIANQQRSGAINATIISTTALGSYTPLATVDSWPYLFDTRAQFDAAYASEDGKAFFAEIEAQSGYRVLSPTYKGARYVFVRRPATELNGLKIRVPGLPVVLRAFESWGVSPTPMDMSEIYTAMQQGVVDGIEIEAQTAQASGLLEVTQSVLLTKHMMPNYAFIFYGAWLDGLPEAERLAIEGAAADASAWFSGEIEAAEQKALDDFAAGGAQLVEVDVETLRQQSAAVVEAEFPDLFQWVVRLRTAAGM